METIQDKRIGSESKAKQLHAILFLLQTNLEEFRDEVDRSYELLKVGEKTDLSKKIEETIDDPIASILSLSYGIDNQVKGFIDRLVKSFLRSHSDIIQVAYKTKTALNDLHYSIVLKEDNMDGRMEILQFLDYFEILDASRKHPVYFQFVPSELIGKIFVIEPVQLD